MNELSTSAQIFLTVTTPEDQNDGSEIDGLSLRDAIIQANLGGSKQYIINVPSNTYNLTLTEEGSLDITSNIQIIGASAANTIISGSFLGDRLLSVSGTGNLVLNNITLQDGNIPTDQTDRIIDGGAILIQASGKASLNNTIIAQNTTNGRGGGVANNGTLELTDSSILVNFSLLSGGGIYNSSTGTLRINRSAIGFNSTGNAIDENTLLGGGGIFNDTDGNVTVVNSTIAGNVSLIGGGIWNQGGNTTIINSTLAQNQGVNGAGIFSGNPQAATENLNTVLQNTIVAKNINDVDVKGTINQISSNNLIGAANGALINGQKYNQVGSLQTPLDPKIDNLPTQFPPQDGASAELVYKLQESSPAINVGSNASAQIRDLNNFYGNTDQTGNPRIIDTTVDIGSFEFTGDDSSTGGGGGSSVLNSPVYRFQNTNQPGTYLFAGGEESNNIRFNYPEFKDEGFAFNVGIAPNDDLIAIYRFQNLEQPGTYLFANQGERDSILSNYDNFIEEGIAFYVYGADANKGQDIFRFQNLDQPGTYLYVAEAEKNSILNNFKNFVLEGVAFEVSI